MLKKILKLIYTVLTITIFAVFLASCEAKSEPIEFDEIHLYLDNEAKAVFETMVEFPTTEALEDYQIPSDLVKNAIFMRSAAYNICADELIIIEASSSVAIDSLKTVFAKIQQEKYSKFENGESDEFDKLNNYKTAIFNRYMIYVVSDEADTIIKCFENIFG